MRQDVMAALVGDDPSEFEAFYREHVEAVQRFVAQRVDDPQVAADLTADIFLAVIEAASGYRADLGPPSRQKRAVYCGHLLTSILGAREKFRQNATECSPS